MPLPKSGVISRGTLFDQVYDQIRNALMSGALAPGEVVTIRALADTLDVSTMPVRDALKRLVAENILEMLPNRSVCVPHMTRERMIELYDIRQAIEGMATERATPLLDDQQIDELEKQVEQMVAATVKHQAKNYLEQHYTFQFTIFNAYSEILVSIIESLWLRAGPLFKLYFEEREFVDSMPDYYSAIISALRARDGAKAREVVEGYLTEAKEFFINSGNFE